jgi:hypothetical protein
MGTLLNMVATFYGVTVALKCFNSKLWLKLTFTITYREHSIAYCHILICQCHNDIDSCHLHHATALLGASTVSGTSDYKLQILYRPYFKGISANIEM